MEGYTKSYKITKIWAGSGENNSLFVKRLSRSNSCENFQIFERNSLRIRSLFQKLPDYHSGLRYIGEEGQKENQKKDDQKHKKSKSSDERKPSKESQSKSEENFQQEKFQQIELQNAKNYLVYKTEDWCCDVLQLEAFNYQLTSFGLSRSPLLSLAPIIAYYTYSIQINDIQSISHLYQNDFELQKFYNLLKINKILMGKLKLQVFTQLTIDQINQKMTDYNDSIQFLSIIPIKIESDTLDTKTILNDYDNYSSLYINQEKNINDSLQPTFIYRKNNVLIAFIRFIFLNNKTNQSIDYRFPISEFDDIPFIDHNQFEYNQDWNLPNSVKKFLLTLHTHSEKSLTLYLMQDAITNKRIFTLLQSAFEKEQIDQKQLILNSIQFEITSEQRICNLCVNMFSNFPIQYYCLKLSRFFSFTLNEKFYLTILSQFLSNPRYRSQEDQQWENQPLSLIIEAKKQVDQSDEYQSQQEVPSEENQQDIQQISIEQKPPQNKEQNTRYFIAQFELNPTGLISNQFFTQRYLLQGKECFKTPINEVLLNNTFFISSGSDESEKQSQQKSSIQEQQIELQNEKQVEISDEKKSKKQNKKSNEKQSKKSSEKVNWLLSKLNEFEELFKATKLSQKTLYNSMIQKEHQQINSFEQIADEIKYNFISTIIKSISQFKLEKKCNKLGFREFYNQLFQLLVQQWKQGDKKFEAELFKNGIIFNYQLNRQLIIKDYLFFQRNVSLLNTQTKGKNQSLIYNEFIIQLVCENRNLQQFTLVKLQDLHHQIIESCKDFYEKIKELIQIDQLNDCYRYHLLIVSVQKIDERCMQQIAKMLTNDEQYKKFRFSFQFISLELSDDDDDQLIEKNIQQIENNKEVSCEIYNPLIEKEFIKRYKICKKGEILPYCDTEDVMGLNFYKCIAHHGLSQVQI